MGRLYKINPPCPKCHEEHNWWHIQLTNEEQAKMDAYVAASEGKSSLELLLGEPGIVVTRKLKCCCCGHVFEAEAGLRKFDEVGYRDRDFMANRNKWLKTHIPSNNLYDVLRLKTVEECHANLPSKMILARYFYAITEMRVSSITG
mgnify:CR=1 FL=1